MLKIYPFLHDVMKYVKYSFSYVAIITNEIYAQFCQLTVN